jgi:DNA segregation ATPase FtsK/SpoIIIE-like protein
MNEFSDRVGIADKHLGTSLLSALIDELKALPDVWQKMPAHQQAEVIDRLKERVGYEIQQAAFMMASNDCVYVVAQLDTVTFKAGVEAKLKIHPGSPHRLELADNAGQSVLIVLTNVEEYVGGMDDIKADPDQKTLPIDYNEADGAKDPVYNEAIVFLSTGGSPSISSVQRKLRIGYNRAANLMTALERNDLVTIPNAAGARQWLGDTESSGPDAD